ncbi:MAG TPA: FtsX-like permease family protein [Actinomycetota bacterium]
MAMLRFLFRRLVAQRLLALGVVLTLAFSVGVMASGPIYTDAARDFILASSIATAGTPIKNVRVDVYGDPSFDWTAADRQVRTASSVLPVDTIVTQGETTVRLGPSQVSVPMLFRDGENDHLAFRSGSGPGSGQVAIPYGLAQSFGIRPGDRVDVLGPTNQHRRLEVSGIFDPPERLDAFWFGEGSPFPLGDSEDPVPVIVDRGTARTLSTELDLSSHYAWDVYLAVTGISYVDAVNLPDAYVAFTADINDGMGAAQQPPHVSSGVQILIAGVQRSVADLRVPILLVLLQILVVTLVVLAGVGVLLVSRQSFELAVLHSRGFTARTLLLAQGVQALLAAVLALPIGIAIGALLARFAGLTNGPRPGDSGFPTSLSLSSIAFGAAAAVAGAIVLWLPSIPAVRRTIIDERRQTSREARPALARAPVELIVLPVGFFALAQLRNGEAIAPAAAGQGSIDPLLLFGPTLVILGASFLVIRVLSWGLASLDGRIGRSRRLSTYLAGRRLGRAPGVAFASAVLVVLATGLLFISTTYRATTLQNHEDAAHAFAGADWVATVGSPTDGSMAFDRPLPPGMADVARVQPDGFGGAYSDPPEGLAVDPATFRQAAWWRADFATDPFDVLLDHLATPAEGMTLPPGSRTLSLTIDAPADAAGLELRAAILGADGSITATEPLTLAEGSHPYELDVSGGSTVLSLTFVAPSTTTQARREPLTLTAVTVDGTPWSLAGWVPLRSLGAGGRITPAAGGWTFEASFGVGSSLVGIEPKPAPIPAIVSSEVAQREPATMRLRIGDRTIPIERVGTATSFPGIDPTTPFIVVSGPALFQLQGAVPGQGGRVTEVWAHGDTDPTLAIQQAGFPVVDLLSAHAIEGRLAEAPQSLAVGLDAAAAIAGLGLVIAGVTATLYFAQRRRDFEFASLRAMGAGPTTLRATIAREQSALIGAASIAGMLLGYVVVRLATAPLLKTVSTTFPAPVMVIDVPVLIVALIVIGVATTITVVAATRALLRSPISAVLRGDPE